MTRRQLEQAALAVSVPLFLLGWELLSRSRVVNMALFPPPTTVAIALWRWALDGSLWADVARSLSRLVVGYLLGASIGALIGIVTGHNRLIGNLLSPIFQILRPIPPIAFLPIAILWFGLSEAAKYFLIFWGVFFTVWIAAHLGVQRVDRTMIRAAQVLGTPRRKLLWEILVPGALPYIFVGLRTGVSIAFYALVAAELAGTFSGVVYRMNIAEQNLQIGQMMGGLVLLGLMSAIADRGFNALSRKLVWWQ